LNTRFPYKAISWGTVKKMRVFRDISEALPTGSTIVKTIYDSVFPPQSGDIYIAHNGETYIYVLTNEIAALGIQVMPTTGDYAQFNTNTVEAQYRGGWVHAAEYWTRSVIATSSGMNFAYEQQHGTPNISTANSASSSGLSLMYTIAI